jgi:formate-dependent nitrite reductase membrane component NrfD
MVRRELPIVASGSLPLPPRQATPEAGDGRLGTAVLHARDGYRDVPILQQPTWGSYIAAYFFMGGISSGAAALGSLAEVTGGSRREALSRLARYVAFISVLPCPPLLIADLGKPSRFHHMLRIFKPSSPMNFGAWVLTMHGMFSAVSAAWALAGDGKLPILGGLLRLLPERALAPVTLPPALSLGGYTGVLLGTTSIPVWFTSPLLGGLFMTSSLSTGVAATSLAGSLTSRTEAADQRVLGQLGLMLGTAELMTLGGYLATSGKQAKPLMSGRTGNVMAGAMAGLALAAALEAIGLVAGQRSRRLGDTASIVALVGGGLLRWSIVIAGGVSARDRAATLEAMQPSPQAPGWPG